MKSNTTTARARLLIPLLLLAAFLTSEPQAHAKAAWIKSTNRIELKSGPSNSSPSNAMLAPGEEVEILSAGQGVWSQIRTKRGNIGYIIRFALSTTPLTTQAGTNPNSAELESQSLKELRARRSGAATLGVRGLQARSESGEPEVQDFAGLEKLESSSKELESNPAAQQVAETIRREFTPR